MSRVMKDSGIEWIGETPQDWETKPLKAILVERKEKNDPIKTENILSLTNTRGVIPYEEKGDVGNKSKDDLSGYKLAYPNDIVVNSMNVIIGSVGLSKYFGAVSPVYYMLYSRNQRESNINYYNYIFQTEVFQKGLKGLGNGILEIRMRIPMSKLNKVGLPVPQLPTQQRIASYLDEKCKEIDSIIENTKATIEEYKKYKQSVITEAVTKGLDSNVKMKDSGIEWIGEIPQNYELIKLSKIATVKSNLVHPTDYLEYYQIAPDGIEKDSGRLLYYKTVRESGVISDNHLFYKGQILYSKIRPKLNKVIIAPFDGLCSADMYPIETECDNKFLLYIILSKIFYLQISAITENRVKMPKINQQEIGGIIIINPPNYEQKQIADYLDVKCSQINTLISKKQQIISELQSYKKSLIYECVTGKVDV